MHGWKESNVTQRSAARDAIDELWIKAEKLDMWYVVRNGRESR
jgi:hypothetical protein